MIIAVNTNKGGSLKTTTATNLAGVIASKGKKVLLIDADSQANATLTFGFNPDDIDHSMYSSIVNGYPPEESIMEVDENLYLLPSNNDLISFEFEVIGNPLTYEYPFELMKEALSGLRDQYDYIIIDTPPSLGLTVGNAFVFADKVLIPYLPESYSKRSLSSVLNTIIDFREDFNENLRILGILEVMANKQSRLHKETIEETKVFAAANDIKMFETVIPRTVQFANAVADDSLPAAMLPRKYPKAKAYYKLWEEIEGMLRKEVRN